MYRIYWTPSQGGTGRWKAFENEKSLNMFVEEMAATDMPVGGEVLLEAMGDEPWSITTTVGAIARWTPPTPPSGLLASRTASRTSLTELRGSILRDVSSVLTKAVGAGLLSIRQAGLIDEIFGQALEGLGPAGREIADDIEPRGFPASPPAAS